MIAYLGGGTVNFSYDANGNMTLGYNKTMIYNAFNKPTSIASGGITSTFKYGADLLRCQQVISGGGSTDTMLYLDKLIEIEANGSKIDYRYYLGDAGIHTQTHISGSVSGTTRFFLRDRLGSVVTTVDEFGNITARTGYDPFGKPRDGDWDALIDPADPVNGPQRYHAERLYRS